MACKQRMLHALCKCKQLLEQQVRSKNHQMFFLPVKYRFMNFVLELIMKLGKVPMFPNGIYVQIKQDHRLKIEK